jgi:hypothetical protein
MVVGEVVEHIVLADGLLFDTATKSLTRWARRSEIRPFAARKLGHLRA